MENTVANHYNKRPSTIFRHRMVVEKFNKFCKITFHGLSPSYESVLQKVHEETGYAIRTIEDILKENR